MAIESARRPLLVLVASPLLGPSSWSPLARELAGRGWEVLVSADEPDLPGQRPYWEGTVNGVVESLRDVPHDRTVVLVGHSGAGALLPAVARAIRQPVVAFVFLDAGLPSPGRSRLDSMADEGPGGAAFATELATILDAGGRYPEWTDDDLAPLLPNAARRREVLAEMRPRGRDFWTEPLPDATFAPGARCAYVQFSDTYQTAADAAEAMGWPLRYLSAGHFHHLVDEKAVADSLIELLEDVR
jgi:pimeloyl-ACP methyl ester carboxylesterase